MLPKSQRLTTKQFNEVMERGRITHSPLLLMRTLEGQKDTRVSVVAPVKIYKKAVSRNRFRRIAYEMIRPLFDSMKPGSWAIIFAKRNIEDVEPVKILEDLKNLFNNAKVMAYNA